MIGIQNLPSAEFIRYPFMGQLGHGIIYSYPVPPGKIWYLVQAGVGQQVGHDGSYEMGTSIAICYPVAPPFTGIWRHDLIKGRPETTTPLVAIHEPHGMLMTPGETVSARVDRIAVNHGISLSIRYWQVNACEVCSRPIEEWAPPQPQIPQQLMGGPIVPNRDWEFETEYKWEVIPQWKLKARKFFFGIWPKI